MSVHQFISVYSSTFSSCTVQYIWKGESTVFLMLVCDYFQLIGVCLFMSTSYCTCFPFICPHTTASHFRAYFLQLLLFLFFPNRLCVLQTLTKTTGLTPRLMKWRVSPTGQSCACLSGTLLARLWVSCNLSISSTIWLSPRMMRISSKPSPSFVAWAYTTHTCKWGSVTWYTGTGIQLLRGLRQ